MPYLFSKSICHAPLLCRPGVRLAMTTPLMLLAACTSVPLPPWVPELSRPVTRAITSPAPVTVEPAVVIQTMPVAPPAPVAVSR